MQKSERYIRLGLMLILAAFSMFGCHGGSVITNASPGVVAVPTRDQAAFKGMELYSWQDQTGEWQYSILMGTNRIKSISEIQENPMNIGQVKAAISRMAVGESLFWLNRASNAFTEKSFELVYPPGEVIEELKGYAADHQVTLYTREINN